MSLADNIALQLVEAIAGCTPENIKKNAIAKAEALKLTEPEQKKRDEAVAILNSVAPKLAELKAAEEKHASAKAEIEKANGLLDARSKAADKRDSDHVTAVANHAAKVKANDDRAAELKALADKLESQRKTQENKIGDLQAWEARLTEQQTNWDAAQQLLRKKA